MALQSLMGIPGLGGYLGMEQYRQQQALGNLQGQVGLMNAVRQQQAAEREAAMAPIQQEMMRAQLDTVRQAAADRQKRAAFFSPESVQQFITPGTPGIEAPSEALGGGPGRPAGAPQLDLEKFVVAGASQGVFNPEALLNLQQRMQDRVAQREQRMQELQMQLESRKASDMEKRQFQLQMEQMRQENRADMMRLGAVLRQSNRSDPTGGLGKPPMGYRFTPDGNLEPIPGGPADVKAQASAQRAADGASDVDVTLTQLRDAYDRLEKGGGITSTQRGALGNMAAATSSSTLGQAVGRALGTENQSARNEIAMARPALLAAIMKATGMSAKQMDSNTELKLWLSTATDPTLDVEANRRALNNIEQRFLRRPTSSGAGGSFEGPPPGVEKKIWDAMTPEQRALWKK